MFVGVLELRNYVIISVFIADPLWVLHEHGKENTDCRNSPAFLMVQVCSVFFA